MSLNLALETFWEKCLDEATERLDGAAVPSKQEFAHAAWYLRRLAMRLHRSYETACNREQSARERLRERKTEAAILAKCHTLGLRLPIFNGDPRGAPVKIPVAKGRGDAFESDALLIVPYLSADEYRKSA